MSTRTIGELLRANEDLRHRLEEAEDTLRALRAGEVDAVVVERERVQVLTMETADTPYRLMVEQVRHGAAAVTCDGQIIHCNRRLADMVGRPLEALRGVSIVSLAAPEGQSALAALLRDGRETEATGDVALHRDDGVPVTVHLSVTALKEGALGPCLMVTDLTERRDHQDLRRVQEALRASEEELRVGARRKDEFLATLAHELRNPLAPIRTAIHLLKARGSSDPDHVRVWGVLDRQVHVMARLLEDLLDVSRISRNALELRTERVGLSSVLEAAVAQPTGH